MILRHFRKPKWQHNDPEIRKRALDKVPDQETLIDIARTDTDASVRRDACKRIKDLKTLHELAAEDPDAGIREVAGAHYRQVLCGQEPDGPSLEQRLAFLDTLDSQRILEQIAVGGQEPDLRSAAIGKLANPEVLAECACNDAVASNRANAAQRIEDKSALETLARRTAKKDKSVYRLARQKLKHIAEREAAPERTRLKCEDLCEKVERLGRLDQWVQDKTMLDHLDKQWAALEAEAEPAWRERYQASRRRFLTAYETLRRENQAQIEAEEAQAQLRQRKRSLIDSLREQAAQPGGDSDLEALIARSTEAWDQLERLPETEEERLLRDFAGVREQLCAELERRKRQQAAAHKLERLLQHVEATLHQNAPLDHKRVQRQHREATALLEGHAISAALRDKYRVLDQELTERLHKQRHAAEQKLAHLPEKLDELVKDLDDGELRKAEALYQSIQAGLNLLEASEIPRQRFADIAKRFHTLAPRVRELQKWRRWGTDQHREELCLTMERLGQEDLPLERLAARLHETQMEWKRLDKDGSPANHPLWERFHQAAERVYERCRPYLDEQAVQRQDNRRQREELCARLEEFLDKVDWDKMDWKKAVRAERETRGTWASLGPVDGKFRKGLDKRFRSAMKRLDKHLAEERGRNLALKRDLIEQVEALEQEPDLDQAIRETKRLQRQWYTTVPARQQEENRLWRRFRGACNQIFERQRAEHEAHRQQLQNNLQARQALCEALRSLVLESDDPHAVRDGARELERRWRETTDLELPRGARSQVEKAWREAQQQYRQQLQQIERRRERDQLDQLRQRALLCQALERQLDQEHAEPATLSAIEAEWNQLPALVDADLHQAIERRFLLALKALQQDETSQQELRAARTDQQRRREELCLHLEILAGVDSPPELAQERLGFQVNRLTEHMREGEKDPLEGAPRLEKDWYLCGPAPSGVAATLEARFERAREALLRKD